MPSVPHKSHAFWPHLSGLSQVGVLVAVCVASGYLLAAVPNVELLTTSVFIAGCLTGILQGALIGATSMGVYSLLNPYGMAPPPLWVSQVLSYAIVGGMGGFLGKRRIALRRHSFFLFGLCGFWFTLQYLLLTTLAYGLTVGKGPAFFLASLIQGVGFLGIHVVSNTVFFVFLVPYLLGRLHKMGWGSFPKGRA